VQQRRDRRDVRGDDVDHNTFVRAGHDGEFERERHDIAVNVLVSAYFCVNDQRVVPTVDEHRK